MASNTAKIRVEFFGRDKTLGKTFRDQMKAADTFGKKMQLLGARMQTMGRTMTLGMTVPIVAGLTAATKAAMDDERSQRVLAQQIRNTVDATDAEIASVEKFIDVQARATGVADDELRPAFAKLVTATEDVTRAQALMAIAQDTAAGTGRGLDSVITAMMKGQNGQVDLFGRMGVATKNAAGETLTFDEVLANLKEKFDGLAATKADPFAKMKVAFGELGEAVGTFLVPAMETLASKITGLLAALENLSPFWRKIAIGVALVAAAAGPLVFLLGSMARSVTALTAAYNVLFVAKVRDGVVTKAGIVQMTLLRAKLIAHAAASKVAAAAQWLWNVAMSANPVGLVIAAIGALIAIFAVLYKKNATFRGLVQSVWGGFKKVVSAVGDALKWVVGKFGELWGWVKEHKAPLANALKFAFWPIMLAIQNVKLLIGALQSAWELAKKAAEYVGGLGGGAGAGKGKGGRKLVGASGGVFTGPRSGYPVTMHGTEAIVPLESPTDAARTLAAAGLMGGVTFTNCTFSAHTPQEIADSVIGAIVQKQRHVAGTTGAFA